ncbi:transcription initiation factor subunit [Eremomyces bilateralis CBS 781.70]|uniref:Transcription initiation factor subunit n=1 Tax=Eremomyces bilateralis CBS 781.70 TaxID=1392243 RepID=A0A6G1GA98_9PEZI|nr:transcription initiation factor subunit [Eremomyces bilateralis CBS 781.70]KAF1814831.1 transcription initiation factor subunit [Eremomyces bilateralis CBS 781.70]
MPTTEIKRTIKLVTHQRISQPGATPDELPLRSWSVELYVLHEGSGEEMPAVVFDKVEYNLHPSFEKRAKQTFKKPPFKIQENGWGEFDMLIKLYHSHKGGESDITHDLNFQSERYESKHVVVFKNPKPELVALLKESGPVGEENGVRGKKEGAERRKSKKGGNIDMERLAENLQRLSEDDLLNVVQMVHDGKSPDTYTKNDVEAGEFHVDLYTLPDLLVKSLWDFTEEKLK